MSTSVDHSVDSDAPQLRRVLGLGSVFSIAAGAMISSGLFVLPGIAFAQAGPACILSYALAATLIIPLLFSITELATAMPKSGGSYIFIERSLGPLFGTIAGFVGWMAITLKTTFALVGLGSLGALVLTGSDAWSVEALAVATGGCFFFMAINIIGVKESGRLQGILVAGLLGIIAFYCVGGIFETEGARYLRFFGKGGNSMIAVAGMVFVSFGGLTKVVAVAEEVKNPTRNLPLGMFAAAIVVSLLYVLVVFVTVGVTPPEDLAGSLSPLTHAAEQIFGRAGTVVIGIAAFLAFATTANSGIMTAARSPLAMSRDGLLPAFLSRNSRRFGTPVASILVTVLVILGLLALLDVEALVKTASAMMLLMFMLVNVSVVIMRASGVENYRPTFRSPLFPWLQIVVSVAYAFLILEMGRTPLMVVLLFCLFAIAWYTLYVHSRIDRQSALLYMIKRMLSRHMGRARLDEELVGILLERDDIAFDRFDHLVSHAPVLDIDEAIDARALFRRISVEMAPELKMEEETLYDLFLERERDSSTVIQPQLAIPHIVVPGEHVFRLVLVRCREGARFDDLHDPVTTAFALIGSPDERNYHLRALMHIAQIVQEEHFAERWMAARNSEQLRAVLHLSGRPRGHSATS